jgi:protein-arginine kinase
MSLISSDEMMTLLSDLRLGIYLGIIEKTDLEKVNCAMYSALPATITAENNIQSPLERDLKRAEIMKEYLN